MSAKTREIIIVLIVASIVIFVPGVIMTKKINNQTLTEKAVIEQQKMKAKALEKTDDQKLQAAIDGSVHQGMIYLRAGKTVKERAFYYRTFDDIDLAVGRAMSSKMNMKCDVIGLDFGEKTGLSIGILCEPKGKK